jgi:hypothetical protein
LLVHFMMGVRLMEFRPPPGPTASGTTSNCGAWYSVKTGDFCQKVVVNSQSSSHALKHGSDLAQTRSLWTNS